MKPWRTVCFLLLLLLVVGSSWLWWRKGEPRRASIQTLQRLDLALQKSDTSSLLEVISAPAAIRDRTAAEHTEFLAKALRDEISAEGLAVLQREGEFGSLTNLFPNDGSAWASQAGVNPENCVAFKLERNGLIAEVVLVNNAPLPTRHSSPNFQIVRCNNVKQLASANSP